MVYTILVRIEPGTEAPASEFAAPVTRMKRWLRPVMLVVALACMAGTAYELARRWDGRGVQQIWWLLALSLAPLMTASWVQAYGWTLLIDHLTGRRAPRGAAAALYLDSQLARYTPGKVGLPVVRMAGANRIGVAARIVGTSILVEVLSWMTTAALTGFGLLLLSGAASSAVIAVLQNVSLIVLVLAVAAVVLLASVDRRRLPGALCRRLNLEGTGPLMPWGLPMAHGVYWALWAIHGYCVVRGFCGSDSAARSTTGYFVLAPVIGFLTLVAPAGVGVREAILSLGLAPSLGVTPALAAGLASRVVSLAADLCTWAVCRLLGRKRGWL